MRYSITKPRASAIERGFTIVELLITIAVLGVLTSITVPSLGAFLKNSGLRGTVYELTGAIALARSEAIKRGSKVILCRSGNPHAAVPACSGNAKDWSTGWLVFVAEDGNLVFDVGTDVLLGIGEATPNGIALQSNSIASDSLTYQTNGSTTGAATATFAVCDSRGPSYGKQINVTRVGRPDLISGSITTPLASCNPSS